MTLKGSPREQMQIGNANLVQTKSLHVEDFTVQFTMWTIKTSIASG